MSRKAGLKERLTLALAPRLAEVIVRFIHLTMRIEDLYLERVKPFWDEDRRMILAVWHGRLIMIPIGYRGRYIKCLISHHKDGEMLARFMARFGHGTVRGSTTRGGAMAMREMLREIKGCDIAVTPDGPKGPRHVVQEGIIALARMTGVPIVPVTFGATRKKIFASWDAFQLPYPFSRGAFLWGEPISVGRDDDPEAMRQLLERRLLDMNGEVDRYLLGS